MGASQGFPRDGMGNCVSGRAPFLQGRRGAFGSHGLFIVTLQGRGFAEPRRSAQEQTQRGSERSSGGAGTMRETDSCRERLRRRDREGGRGRGGDRDGQRPRQSSGEGARAGEPASGGRKSGEDREAAETMKATDTPDTERDPETSTGDRRAERLMKGLREARLGRDGDRGGGHCGRQTRRGWRAPGRRRRGALTSAAARRAGRPIPLAGGAERARKRGSLPG